MKIILTLMLAAFASNAEAIEITQPNLAGQVLTVQDIRPLDNLWPGINRYTKGIYLIDQSITLSTWVFRAVSASTVTLTRLDGNATFFFTITSPPQFGVGVVPDETANIYAAIIKATDSVIVGNNLTAGGTVFAAGVAADTFTVNGVEINGFQGAFFAGVSIPVNADEGIFIDKTGILTTDEAYGYALRQDGQVVGFIAYVEEDNETAFFIGGSTDPFTEGFIKFRGAGAGSFAGDVDINAADRTGSAIHVLADLQFHVQTEIYSNGILNNSTSTHSGSNGKTNHTVCIKSNGQLGTTATPGGTCI